MEEVDRLLNQATVSPRLIEIAERLSSGENSVVCMEFVAPMVA